MANGYNKNLGVSCFTSEDSHPYYLLGGAQ